MLRSMFAKLMAVVLAIVLVCMLALFSLFYISMRDSYIDNRMSSLKTQARIQATQKTLLTKNRQLIKSALRQKANSMRLSSQRQRSQARS